MQNTVKVMSGENVTYIAHAEDDAIAQAGQSTDRFIESAEYNNELRRPRSECTDVQGDLDPRCLHVVYIHKFE